MPDHNAPRAELQLNDIAFRKTAAFYRFQFLGELHHEYQLDKIPA